MHRNLWIALLALCLRGVAGAQDAASYRATFEASLAQIESAFTQRTSALEASYAKSLETLCEQYRVAGDLSGTLATKREIDRFASERRLPDSPSEHAAVAALQEKLRQACAQPRDDRARQTVALADQYDQALERLQRSCVVAGHLPEAQAVQTERERARLLPTVSQSREAVAALAAAQQPPASATAQSPTQAPTPPSSAAASGGMTVKAAKELVAGMDKLSEADWRKLPGSVVTVHADPGKACDTATELAAGDVVLLVPHPRDEWTPLSGRIEECDFRGLRGTVARPRLRIGPIAPMALCAAVGGGFPSPVEGNFLVTGQGKLDLSPGLRAVRLEGAKPRGSIRVKVIRVED